tara:strand:- start:326 stop:934 length:609 start_codon:yes stop_codon:yes gene_type:complete
MLSKIKDELKLNLAIHHELYETACKGEYLEELVRNSAVSVGLNSDWKPDGSHQVGKDQSIDGINISNKSGEFRVKRNGTTVVKITGSRTSSYETLEDKLNFLSDKKYDYTVCCARNKSKWNKGERVYHLIGLPHVSYNSNDFVWEQQLGLKDPNQWKTCVKHNKEIICWIGGSKVSGQLYTEFSSNTFLYHETIDIDDLLNN